MGQSFLPICLTGHPDNTEQHIGRFTVTRDTAPPTFTLSPAVESGALRVIWSSTDPSTSSGQVAASGVDGSACTLEVCEDEGAWQPFSTACAGDEVHGEAQPGHVYTFRLSASDHVSNTASTETLARFPRVTKYYYHPSTGSGQAGGQRVAMRADGVVYYLHGDHLGSTSLTTDASGAVMARQLYHPYGTTRYSEGTLPTDFGFTGQRHVPGTGLVFMHARYYHAGLGRFTQADTIAPGIGSQGLNRYMYVRGNPILYNDPSGHFDPVTVVIIGGLIVGGLLLSGCSAEQVETPSTATPTTAPTVSGFGHDDFGNPLLPTVSVPVVTPTPTASPAPMPSSDTGLALPIRDPNYDNGYGYYPWNDDGSLYLHRGYDITSRSGDRTVYSMGAGEVAEIDNSQHYYVRVEMTDRYYINYVHIETTNLEIGDEVKANDVIGFYGEVGRTTPGYPHLHIQFESPIYQAVNPASYWPGGEPPYWRFGAPVESQ